MCNTQKPSTYILFWNIHKLPRKQDMCKKKLDEIITKCISVGDWDGLIL